MGKSVANAQSVIPTLNYSLLILFPKIWCRRRDSNSHSFRHRPLKTACLPIPPRRQLNLNSESKKPYVGTLTQAIVQSTAKLVYSGISLALEASILAGIDGEEPSGLDDWAGIARSITP